ncbi:hypothetical protein [Parafrigoribacterium humi]|uniref:hypothetical protein n=1 Tax=Parafrigoribacterium humi TaxID=3144664 RepID=UPI0032EE1559
MSLRLPPVLSVADLPLAELCAARLDGELRGIDGYFSPVDEPDDLRHRAAVLAAMAPPRLIAEQYSAAWVWGARLWPPDRQQFCAAAGARISMSAAAPHRLREVVIGDTEYVTVEGLRLTTPLRTAVDIARSGTASETSDRDVLARLMVLGTFGPEDCRSAMNSRRNLPRRNQAMVRLADAARLEISRR